MKLLYIDCRRGVSGDMMLAALVNIADGRQVLEDGLSGLGLDCFNIVYPTRRRGGVEAPGILVEVKAIAPHFDDLAAVVSFLEAADIPPAVRERAEKVFRILADGEAAAHSVAVGYGHFHEVGMVDAIVDIVGSSFLFELIGPDEVIASPVRLGFGTVMASHGPLPVPAPAAAAILDGVPVFAGETEGEFTTPTGAALLKAFADGFGPMPEMTLGRVGYGPGTADPPEFANVLTVYAGEVTERRGEDVAVIEATVDDMTGEALAYATAEILAAGALDVYTTPVYMKKGRPAFLITVLAEPRETDRFAELVLVHTTTFGVRCKVERRRILPREVIEVNTPYGKGKVKVARLPGGGFKFHPEYSSVVELTEKAGVTFEVVFEALSASARREAVI